MNTLLVVEDEKLIRQGIVAMIRRSSVPVEEILECRNGEEALEILRKQRVDVMFTDIRMPKMDGIEMLKELRAEGNDVSVIFLTAYSDFSYAQSALKLFASDYLLKPFGDGELEQAVNHALDKRKKTQEREEKAGDDQLPELVLNKGDKSKYVMAAVDYITEH